MRANAIGSFAKFLTINYSASADKLIKLPTVFVKTQTFYKSKISNILEQMAIRLYSTKIGSFILELASKQVEIVLLCT